MNATTLSRMVKQLRALRNRQDRADGNAANADAQRRVDAHVAAMYAAGLTVRDGVWVVA